MKRKNFLLSIPLAGLSLGLTGFINRRNYNTSSDNLFRDKSRLDKVKLSMLTMQRRAWEQGVAMQAMLESGEEEMVILMAKDSIIYQTDDGRLAMVGQENALTDAASPGEAVLWAAKKTGDPKLMDAFNKLLEYMLRKAPRTEEGIIYHFTHIPQIWCDSNYMLPPFLAAAGEYKEALKQIDGVFSFLWDKEYKMLSHMWDDEKKEFARKDFWGVGNGWSAAGLTRVIHALPESMKEEKENLIQKVKDIIDGCLVYFRPDGFFHNVVNDPNSFVETNLSQMLAYTIYRGIKRGWLDKSYKEKADKMRKAANSKVDELGLVQDVCGAPEFNHAGTAAEGQVFYILMETAYNELVN